MSDFTHVINVHLDDDLYSKLLELCIYCKARPEAFIRCLISAVDKEMISFPDDDKVDG